MTEEQNTIIKCPNYNVSENLKLMDKNNQINDINTIKIFEKKYEVIDKKYSGFKRHKSESINSIEYINKNFKDKIFNSKKKNIKKNNYYREENFDSKNKNIEEENNFKKINNNQNEVIKDNHLNKNQNINNINKRNNDEKKNICKSYITPDGNIDNNTKLYSNNNINSNNENKNNYSYIQDNNKYCLINNNKIKEEEKNEIYETISTSKPFISFKMYKEPPLIIILNEGNISYMICTLQCLANIKNISLYFLKNLKIYVNNYKNKQSIISFYFSRLIKHLFPKIEKTSNKKYSISSFHNYISDSNLIFKGESCKSPIDFLIYLLNELHNEYKIMSNYHNQNCRNLKHINNQNFEDYTRYLIKNENSIIFDTFIWINQKVKRCWGCKEKYITYQNFFTYDLNIEHALNKTAFAHKNEISILNCIEYESREETLYNVFCVKCKKKNNFEKESSIYFSSSVLILLLSGIENNKIIKNIKNENIKIKVDENLDLSNLIKYKQAPYLKYTLHGIILYNSEKMEYFAYCTSPINGKWYKYIKEEIHQAEIKDILILYDFKIFPVILFYRHL